MRAQQDILSAWCFKVEEMFGHRSFSRLDSIQDDFKLVRRALERTNIFWEVKQQDQSQISVTKHSFCSFSVSINHSTSRPVGTV